MALSSAAAARKGVHGGVDRAASIRKLKSGQKKRPDHKEPA
jgi:hypothetical protein